MVKIVHAGICVCALLCGCASRRPVLYSPPPPVVPASELTAQPVYETVPAPAPVLQPVAQPIEVGPVYYEQTIWTDPFWHEHPPVHYPGGHHHHHGHHHDPHARQGHHHGPARPPAARPHGTGAPHPQHAVSRPHATQSGPAPRPASARPATARPATSRPPARPAANCPPVRPAGARPSGPRPAGARPSGPRPSGSRSGHGGRGRR